MTLAMMLPFIMSHAVPVITADWLPNFILSYLGSTVTPGEAGSQFWALIYVFIIFTGVSVAVMSMNWLERKALAHFQIRLGPMRVGPHGLLQPIADAIKLALKEDIIPAEADQFVFWIAPLIGLLAAFTVYTVIPFGPSQAVSDMNIGILFMLGVSSLGVLGVVVAGWASNSHYPLIGALRSSAQMVSYEVAMGLAVVSAILMTSLNEKGIGTLSMIGIVRAQEQQGIWFIFKFFPLGLIAFIIFAIAMIAETNRAPFDMAEAESELTAGYHTEYSGLRWSLFMLAEYAAMIAVSSIAVTLWLGGWMRPFPRALHGPAWDFIFSLFPALTFLGLTSIAFVGVVRMPPHSFFKIQKIGLAAFAGLLGFIALVLLILAIAGRSADTTIGSRLNESIGYIYWFLLKVAVFMYLFIWYRATWPRYRFDQLMRVGWKVLLPISLTVLIITAIVGICFA
jgi:NADH-quinone oxidoreductase subunit H